MAINKTTINIAGMHCTSCSLVIDGDLEDTEGVIEARTNYAKQLSEITFDDNKIGINKIKEVIRNTGYEVAS